jgi:hypothetical protein
MAIRVAVLRAIVTWLRRNYRRDMKENLLTSKEVILQVQSRLPHLVEYYNDCKKKGTDTIGEPDK